MPGFNGIEVAKELTKSPSSPAVVICSIENDTEIVEAARQAGALGYVFKARVAEDLILAVETVAGGQSFVSPSENLPDNASAMRYQTSFAPGQQEQALQRNSAQWWIYGNLTSE